MSNKENEKQLHFDNLSIEDIEGEIWNDIPGFDGIYQASNLGRVKSCDRVAQNGRSWIGRIRRQNKSSSGVLILCLAVGDGTMTTRSVQSLVFEAFNGVVSIPKMQVAHKDYNVLDNKISNLHLMTRIDIAAKTELGYNDFVI